MDTLTIAASWASIIGAGCAVLTTGLAYYLWWQNRDKISAALSALRHYGTRLAASELNVKLDRLNMLRSDDKAQRPEVIALLGDLHGQLGANPRLKAACETSLRNIRNLLRDQSKLTYAAQRSVTSELRESLREYELSVLVQDNREAT